MPRRPSVDVAPSSSPSASVYTLYEVSQHNHPDHSVWTVVEDRVLDITDFLDLHPGGRNIVLAAGLDATVLYHSYHPRGVSAKTLHSLTIGKVASRSKSYYDFNSEPHDFYPTLKRRVHARLRELDVPRRGAVEMAVKAVVIFTTLILTYVSGWILGPKWFSLPQCMLLAVLHGVAAAHVGMSVMHDANHAAFSTDPRVNRVLGWTLDLIGASGCVWSFQHVVSHHAYTNLETNTESHMKTRAKGSAQEVARVLPSLPEDVLALSRENDVDVFSSFPLIRMHPGDERKWFHRYQHIYAPALFGFFTLAKIFHSDINFYLRRRVGHVDMSARLSSPLERVVFVGMKLFNMSCMLLVPLYLHGWQFTLGMLVLAHFVAGEYLAICFIVSHVSEEASFFRGGHQLDLPGSDPAAPEKAKKKQTTAYVSPNDWAALQARSTVNWAAESWFWGAFSGGLNTQLEHHLFPGVNHTAYRFMPPVVREVCQEFGVEYTETKTLMEAFALCLTWLKELGEHDDPRTAGQVRHAARLRPEEE